MITRRDRAVSTRVLEKVYFQYIRLTSNKHFHEIRRLIPQNKAVNCKILVPIVMLAKCVEVSSVILILLGHESQRNLLKRFKGQKKKTVMIYGTIYNKPKLFFIQENVTSNVTNIYCLLMTISELLFWLSF